MLTVSFPKSAARPHLAPGALLIGAQVLVLITLLCGQGRGQQAAAAIGRAPGGAEEVHAATWTFDQTTSGQDIQWVSPTAVDPGASVYDTSYAISAVTVTVSFIGIPFGPIDVTNQIPPEQLAGTGPIPGPAPITIFSDTLAYPAPPEPPSVAALVSSGLDATGHGFFSATNVVLGTLLVNLGFPFGTQSVQITSIRIAGSLTIHATWFDLGHALSGTGGEPLLQGAGTLAGGEPMSLSLSGALPGGTAFLVIGFAALQAPLKGGVLVPSPDIVLPLTIDAFGELVLSAPWPAGLPGDLAIHFQHWIPDPVSLKGFAASNGVRGVTP
jgi:hypothetical protein